MDRNQRKGPAAALLLTSFFLVIYLAMNGSFSLGERTQNPGSPLNQEGKILNDREVEEEGGSKQKLTYSNN